MCGTVVKVNVFIADMKDFSAMNEVYTQYWGENKPSRTYVTLFSATAVCFICQY